eukprot:TRINITY_DN7763_c0_g1_i1.p1 TRINITY_DN7763_c0_g1~~TRINITY_DN7763_c0_g1_i1.p1  ORF type:complete len:214 (-),score=18.48 TRINITY_DN7763_c0_g1_i1:91-732(-)
MPIRYSVIFKGDQEVAKAGKGKDFQPIIDALILKIPKGQESQKALVSGNFSFNYTTQADGYTFMCVADKSHKTTVCFAFLKNLQDNFQPAAASRFQTHMKKEMQFYSNQNEVDKISAIKTELEDVKGIMRENIEKVVQRGDNLAALEESTTKLEADASLFKTRATTLKRQMWYSSIKAKIIISVVVLVVLFAIVWISCGLRFERCGNRISYYH